jgi:GntR family transcriptional repressor for pyruvate dehydrogenase complex
MRTIGRAAPLADQVFGALQAEIVDGRLKAGERLPIEPQLAASFGVSRTVIREAVSRLRNDGLVTTKQGSGIYVADGPVNRIFRMAPNSLENAETIREIFELRLGIEVEAAAHAAKRRTPENLQSLQKALKAIDATKAGADFGVEADVNFHRAVAAACGNAKIAAFQNYLSVFLVQSIAAARKNTAKSPGMVAEVVQEHAAILAAIRQGDAAAAGGAMRTHLLNAQGRLGLLVSETAQTMRRLR